jgi:putative transcriptional regulator
MSKAANSIRKGLEEAIAHAKRRAPKKNCRVHVPVHVDVKAIRTKLGMTQQAFAARFGFSINTLRHWEQGKREPEGPTRAYLLVIDRARDPPYLCEPVDEIRPLMHGEGAHRGVKAAIHERSCSAYASMAAPRCGGRRSRIVADGSTAVTCRSVGSYEPVPAPILRTLCASPSAAWTNAAIRGSATR